MVEFKPTTKEKLEIVLLFAQITVLVTRWLGKRKKKKKEKK